MASKDPKAEKRIQKLKKRKKRARIIIRNLPFQITENDLREHFAQFGTVEEINLLSKSDGKPIGCGFVQFSHVQSAAKAIHYSNLKPILDRPMVVDWAIPKNKFHKEIKQEPGKEDSSEIVIKDEPEEFDMINESIEVDNKDLNLSNGLGDDAEVLIKDDEEAESEEEIKEEIDGEEDEEEEEEEEQEEEEEEDDEDDELKHPRRISNDVSEGKTIFLKNLPFSVKNEELKKYMEQFGPVYYALVCIDPLTEHSKGTAFVKFRNVEDAERCLSAGSQLRIEGQILEAHKALHRNEVENKNALKQQKQKDSRNLYLVKEGVILAGSQAAKGISAADMAKRLQLERWKTQMLRNLSMFVSRIRLVVHNLPPSLNDAKLRQIFKNHSGPKAVITEARVMRDLKNPDANGVGKSKEYGFVAFTSHEDALKALRSINNNPNIFTPHKRPIVAFSIENRIMVNAKQRRVQKSRMRNPLWPGNKEKRKENESNKEIPSKRVKTDSTTRIEGETKPFSGVVSKPGQNRMRSNFKLRTQALMHNQAVKKDKKRKKATKMSMIKKKEEIKSRKEVKPKQGAKKFDADDTNFNKLVNSYKNKLLAVGSARSKWYDTS